MTNSAQENESRSSMIMSMERTLNSSWFARRQQTKDSYCSLSTGQYWDLLTYIDVSSQMTSLCVMVQSCLTCVLAFSLYYRMTI